MTKPTDKEIEEIKKMSTAERLANVRVELQQSNLKKSGHNKFASFPYFKLGDFLPTVNELCLKYRITPNVSIQPKAEMYVSDKNGDAKPYQKFESRGRMIISSFDELDLKDEIVFEMPFAEDQQKSKIQALGSSITYLRRYLYMTAFEIEEDDTVDATIGKDEKKNNNKNINNVASQPQQPQVQLITTTAKEALKNEFISLMNIMEIDQKLGMKSINESLAKFGIKKLDFLPVSKVDEFKSIVNSSLKELLI